MPKPSQARLTNEQIEDELLTSNLINSGGVEDEDALQSMNLNEKKDLMRGIQQSKEASIIPSSPSLLDKSNFPSLPSTSKSNLQQQTTNKLRLPRKSSTTSRALSLDADDRPEKIINLTEDDDDPVRVKKEKFCLPGFVNDNAPPLVMPNRPMLHVECPMYCMEGEQPSAALQRMLSHHLVWKAEYEKEKKRLECPDQCDELEMKESDNDQDDIYEFQAQSPVRVSKTYSNVRKNVPTDRSASPLMAAQPARSQRRASPDSDCIEVEEKPEETQLSEWLTASGSRKSKRNSRLGKAKTPDNVPDVDFGFDRKWDSRSANWHEGQAAMATGSTLNNRRQLPRTPVAEEEKVQCPICQRNFPKSKVENHAALCEGYSGSPMDVEESS